MIKNLIIIVLNKLYISTNFSNFINQINLKFIFFKIINLYKFFHKKNILINDSFYKINQFLKILKKNFFIKIFVLKNKKFFIIKNFYIYNNIKFYKNFIFIIKIKNICIFACEKKKNYLYSILNNLFLIYK